MRVVVLAAVVASLATPCFAQGAQMKTGQQPPTETGEQRSKREKTAAEEKAARNAMERLPDKKFDPWRTAR